MEAAPVSKFVLIWLHGLGDTGPANAQLRTFFKSPRISGNHFCWQFPTAPVQRVTCNGGISMNSWFDLPEIPITSVSFYTIYAAYVAKGFQESPNVEADVMKAVRSVHGMIDKEVQLGTQPNKIFLCGFSQGGALSLASAMLYPQTLGGAAIFSGWIPLDASQFVSNITPEARKTPLLWSHGVVDEVVEFRAGHSSHLILAQAGIECNFKEYPALGHSISAEELKALEEWLEAHMQ